MASDEFRRELADRIGDLTRFAMSTTRDRDIAEELVNETVCAALSLSERYAPGTNMTAWLYAIQVGLHRNMIRRRRTRSRHEGEVLSEPGYPPPQHGQTELLDLTKAMDSLTPDQAEALRLVTLDGMSYADAATAMRCRIGTVQSRVARARSTLSRLMDPDSMDACERIG